MTLVVPELVKKHLRVHHDDDDAEIAAYQAAAESIVVEYLDRILVPVGTDLPQDGEDGYDPDALVVTPAIVAAILLLVGDLYEVREPDPKSTSEATMPRSVRALLAPWRVWRAFDCDS